MEQQNLQKSLGIFSLVALGVSGVIGSGWIYTNGLFFDEYGAGGMIFGLAFGVLLAACVALAYARLAALFPRAGGEVVYSYTALGRKWGFWAGWLLVGAYISSLAFYFTAFGKLLERIVPVMGDLPLYTIAGAQVNLPVLLSGLGLTLLFFALNYFGVSIGAQVQSVLFLVLLIIGGAIAVVGFTQGSVENFLPPFRDNQDPISSILRFAVPGMTYMAGFGLIATLAEDAKLSPKKIGTLVVTTVLLAGTFYCVVLTASAWILPWEEVAGMERGTITAFKEAGFPMLSWGAFAIAILGLLTSYLGLFMATSRIIVAMARVELLPKRLSQVSPKYRSPRNALLFVTVMTIGLGWLGPGAITWFLDTGGIYLGLVWILVVAAQWRLGNKYPHLTSKLGNKAIPAIGALGAAFVIGFAVFPGTSISLIWPAEYIILGLWIALGAILLMRTPKVDEDNALSDILGDYKDVLSPSTERK